MIQRPLLVRGVMSCRGGRGRSLCPLVPSTSLLVGLAGVDFDDHQRFRLKWALLSALIMLLAGLVTTVIPIVGRAHGV